MARRRTALAGIAAASAAAAVAAAVTERRAVARWETSPDPYDGEPHSVPGDETIVTSSDGARLRAVETGTGPTAVLVHGVTGAADHWAPVTTRLVRHGLRVVAFDQRGHGRSSAGSGRFTAELFGDDLEAVIAELAPEGAVVVGHSLGGITIQSWVAGHPRSAARAAGLVLVATLYRPVTNPLTRLMGRLGGTSLARRTMAHPVHGRMMARGGMGRRPSITVLDMVRDGWVGCPDSTRAGIFRDLDFDFTDVLPTVETPVTVVCGDRDRVTPVAESEAIAGLVPASRLEIVPDAGHEVIWEAADVVADAIAELALNPGGTA